MRTEEFGWLAGVIAAHPRRTVRGRTRLQKTVKLLQRLGLPTAYSYSIHFYGPYSEDLHSDIILLQRLGLIEETADTNPDGNSVYVIKATEHAVLPAMEEFRAPLQLMTQADPVVLELAATYDAFREMGLGHKEALARLRHKKGSKCESGREQQALQLLHTLGLPKEQRLAA